MTRVSGAWITNPDTQAVCGILTDAGYQALFVGGCVRNALLGVPVNDIDIATDAVPDVALGLLKDVGLKTIQTGFAHGTITAISGGIPHEITTFRRDIETFGRHATVEHTKDVEEDARRRDFTMNALYAAADGIVIDPLNGMQDLQDRRLRFIDDPAARIQEDYLRILRFFRFHAWYGNPSNGVDAEGLAACAEYSEGLETLSKERIGAEVLKLLAASNPAQSVASLASAGCLHRVLPGADAKSLPILLHLEPKIGAMPNPIRRLAALGGRDVKDLLRLSKADENRRNCIVEGVSEMTRVSELAYRHGKDIATDIALLRAATFEMHLDPLVQDEIELGANATFPIKSADLIGVDGPALGARLRELESIWIKSGFTATKAVLLAPDRS